MLTLVEPQSGTTFSGYVNVIHILYVLGTCMCVCLNDNMYICIQCMFTCMYFLHVYTLSHTCICTVYNVYVFMDRVKRSSTLFLQLKRISYAMSSGSCPPIRVRYSLETKYPNVTSVPSVQGTLSLYLLVRTHTHTHTYMCIHIYISVTATIFVG